MRAEQQLDLLQRSCFQGQKVSLSRDLDERISALVRQLQENPEVPTISVFTRLSRLECQLAVVEEKTPHSLISFFYHAITQGNWYDEKTRLQYLRREIGNQKKLVENQLKEDSVGEELLQLDALLKECHRSPQAGEALRQFLQEHSTEEGTVQHQLDNILGSTVLNFHVSRADMLLYGLLKDAFLQGNCSEAIERGIEFLTHRGLRENTKFSFRDKEDNIVESIGQTLTNPENNSSFSEKVDTIFRADLTPSGRKKLLLSFAGTVCSERLGSLKERRSFLQKTLVFLQEKYHISLRDLPAIQKLHDNQEPSHEVLKEAFQLLMDREPSKQRRSFACINTLISWTAEGVRIPKRNKRHSVSPEG
ncbi:MAG: hypothetical protein FJZ58_00600 [Chlamydiae bacterium]|nr:hypothetical protein [Chlamydiota bacterium]